MSESGLLTTFTVLYDSRNTAATRSLVAALDSSYPGIRSQAFHAILHRQDTAGFVGLIQRYHMLTQDERDLLYQRRDRMLTAVRKAILRKETQIFENGCAAAVDLEQFDLLPTLINALESPLCENRSKIREVFQQLIHAFHTRWWSLRETGNDNLELRNTWRRMVEALSESVDRYAHHHCRETVEAFLLLADPSHPLLLELLSDPLAPTFSMVVDILSASSAQNVVYLLYELILAEKTPTAVLSVAGNRKDIEFVTRFLTFVDERLTPEFRKNLKRIRKIAWAEEAPQILLRLEGRLQAAAVKLVTLSGVGRDKVESVARFLLINGSPEGRREAARAIAEFRGAETNELVVRSLEDPDPGVQAAMVAQLRERGIPGSLLKIVEMIQSPHEEVRDAVREALPEFQFERFWDAYPYLKTDVQAGTGKLVKLIDLKTIEKLRRELSSPIRSRQLQALAVAERLELTSEVEEDIYPMVRSGDRELRTEAILALEHTDSELSLRILSDAMSDPSSLIQAAARRVLQARLARRQMDAAQLATLL